nr:tyrosine-type recombinase/integrase [Streptomyces platensis]
MWNKRSWRPTLAAAGLLKAIGEKVATHGGRVRRYPVYELSRADMFHVLRHTYANTQLEAGESLVSVSEWLGHASPQTTLKHYAHFMPGAGKRGLAKCRRSPPTTPERSTVIGAALGCCGRCGRTRWGQCRALPVPGHAPASVLDRWQTWPRPGPWFNKGRVPHGRRAGPCPNRRPTGGR